MFKIQSFYDAIQTNDRANVVNITIRECLRRKVSIGIKLSWTAGKRVATRKSKAIVNRSVDSLITTRRIINYAHSPIR